MVIGLMQGEHTIQASFFGMIYENLIPADHVLRKRDLPAHFHPFSPLGGHDKKAGHMDED